MQTGAPSPGLWEYLFGSLEGTGGCLWVGQEPVCPSHESLCAECSLSVNREKVSVSEGLLLTLSTVFFIHVTYITQDPSRSVISSRSLGTSGGSSFVSESGHILSP